MGMSVSSFLSIDQINHISNELSQESIKWKNIGQITKEKQRSFFSFSRFRFYQDQSSFTHLIHKVNQTLINLEQKGIKIFDPDKVSIEYQNSAANYKEKYKNYFTLIEEIKKNIEKSTKINPELQKEFDELKRREVSLKYSLGFNNGGLDRLEEPDQIILGNLRRLAEDWKAKPEQVVNPHLNELEDNQLKELACYPNWIQTILEDPHYLKTVFDWSLHTFNQVEIIVKCPEIVEKLDHALLKSNVGYVRNLRLTRAEDEVLAFREVRTKTEGIAKRILTMAVYNGSFQKFEPEKQKRFNILKPEEEIHFQQGNYTLTVNEFLHEMAQKNKREANISLCADWGFVNFHPVKGHWNAQTRQYEMPSLTAENWLNLIPAAKIVSHQELVNQYGNELENRQCFFKIMSGTKNTDLNAFDSHAFWQIYWKMEEGNWKVMNIGAFAYRFPQSLLDGLGLFSAELSRVICMGDQNGYYTHRQKAAFSDFTDEKKQKELFQAIYELISQKGLFQFAGDNCAHSVQEITKKYISIPNFFNMPLAKAKTGIKPIDIFLKKADSKRNWVNGSIFFVIQNLLGIVCSIINFTQNLIGPKKRSVKQENTEMMYSLRKYFIKNKQMIYNPAFLNYQIRNHAEGFSQGELYWGHTDEKIFQLASSRIE